MIRCSLSLAAAASLLLFGAMSGQAQDSATSSVAIGSAVTAASSDDKIAVSNALRKKKDQRICKSVAPTGTRLSKRTCLTVAQWEEAQRIAKEAAEKAQTSSLMINKEGN